MPKRVVLETGDVRELCARTLGFARACLQCVKENTTTQTRSEWHYSGFLQGVYAMTRVLFTEADSKEIWQASNEFYEEELKKLRTEGLKDEITV